MGSIFNEKELARLEFIFYCFIGIICLIGCCVGCCCKIAYDRFVSHQHQESIQNGSDFSREIELSSNPDIEESVSLLGNSHED